MKNPTTERPTAPETEAPVAEVTPPAPPRVRTIERQGDRSEPYTHRLPQIRGGVCEFCGIIDNNIPSQHQYKLCPHYRNIGQVHCSYCDGSKDPDEVISMSAMNVAEHPDKPDQLVVWCDRYECSRKHEARFRRN